MAERTEQGTGKRRVKKAPAYGFWLFIFSVAANLLLLAMPIYLSQIYNRVLPSSSLDTLLYLTVFMLFCLALFGAMESIRNDVAQKLSMHYELSKAPEVLDGAVQMANGDPNSQSALLGDIASVRQVLSSRAFVSLFDLPFAPLFLLILYFVHPWLGALAAAGAVLLVAIAVANEMLARGKQAQLTRMTRKVNAKSSEIVRHRDDIRAMGMGSALVARWENDILDAAAASNGVAAVNGSFFGFVRFARQGIQIGILGCGAYLVISEHLSAGLIFASSVVSGRALMPIEQIIGGWRQLSSARGLNKRIQTYLSQQRLRLAPGSRIEMPAIKGTIVCDGVSYVPDPRAPDKAVLRNVSFAVEPGQIVAVIGSSGAGKTTLMRLLANVIQPTQGKISVDGFDMKQWLPEQLGTSIGYAGQENAFFDGTLAENIARFSTDATDEEITQASSYANAHEFIGSLPGGYGMALQDATLRLSGGQKQRVALARAFFRDPQILLLDEPDAHLDLAGEQALQSAMLAAKSRGRTILFVTQRMKLAHIADKVLHLEAGSVVRFADREEVFRPRTDKAAQPVNASFNPSFRMFGNEN
ncbi:type I secretion system permease/ATPase [uncultured Cohaesibacter sp.]|uniref:type I secretion system permease/ATPase n=1 Tax=uncultured Cohaesibacter sp. TaxID=1002546 RepID=UPI0029C7AE0F|nr:type I secretion system permease/ATPase [uncultured Cohaesibacter sp.]